MVDSIYMETSVCPWPKRYWDKSFLRDFLKALGLSRQKIKKHCSNQNEVIERLLSEDFSIPFNIDLLNDEMVSPIYLGQTCSVVFEDKIFLALNKASKVHSQSHRYSQTDTAQSYLRSIGKGSFFYHFNQKDRDKGLLYRLDYETSGLLIFIKSRDIHERITLSRDFYIKKKIYQALVKGDARGIEGSVEHYLSPFSTKGMTVKASSHEITGARLAKLKILEVQYDQDSNLSRIVIQIYTGLRHQIRVQLKSLGFPIVGDTLYGDGEDVESKLFLHACKYEIQFDGHSYTFRCDPSW